MLQHHLYLIHDEIAVEKSAEQACLVVLTHMRIHRQSIVGKIPTMGVEHVLHITAIAQLDLTTSKGACFVESS